ncbi:MAG: hypothetical protein IH624_11980 [Phycisphaerae bacterium]|nr:hypothetical protein [Phycisphaerae bacterium]
MDKDEHVKEVYAHFGLAVYYAQVLEFALTHALVYTKLVPEQAQGKCRQEHWVGAYGAFMDQQFSRTLGEMIRRLRKVTNVPEGLESLLAEALARRNWLVHGYFRERAEDYE